MRNKMILFVILLWSVSICLYSQSLEDIMNAPKNGGEALTVEENSEVEAPTESVAQDQSSDTKIDSIRQRIVELAGSKVGTVWDKAGDDGCKIGWQNLKEFYETAYRLNDIEKERPGWLAKLKGVNQSVNSWCGIFDTWAWMKSGLPVYWNTRIIGCKYRGDKGIIGAGDIIILKKSVNPYNHHAIIKSVNGDEIETIDGNQGLDSIKFRKRKLSDVEIFYSVAEAAGNPPQAKPTKPGSSSGNSGAGTVTKPGNSGSTPAKPGTSGQVGGSGSGNSQAKPKEMSEKEIEEFIRKLLEQIMSSFGFF